MNPFHSLKSWFASLLKVFRREFYLVFTDAGVMIFFFLLPLAYPVVYTLIYNPEVVKEIPVAVVDECRTSSSRELSRMVDATEGISVYAQATSLDEARRLHRRHEVYGILLIPADYDKCIGRGEQANVTFYSDMGLLLRFRTFMLNLTGTQIALCAKIRAEKMSALAPLSGAVASPQIEQEAVMIGDPTQGFASFIIPGIIVIILQQSMLLGVAMLAAGGSERRRRYGHDPLAIPAPASASVMAKALCYLVLYLPLTIYMLEIIPAIFSLPHVGNLFHNLIFITPLLLASAFLGMAISVFVTERESSLVLLVFSSVVILFLSGLTWPRYAMNGFWRLLGDAIPAVWGAEGFVRLNSNGSTLAEQSHHFAMLWILAGAYFLLAAILFHCSATAAPKPARQQ